jgi:hypothetical protein
LLYWHLALARLSANEAFLGEGMAVGLELGLHCGRDRLGSYDRASAWLPR